MDQVVKNRYAQLHQQMFHAHQSGDSASRDRFRVEMETLRQSQIGKLGVDAGFELTFHRRLA